MATNLVLDIFKQLRDKVTYACTKDICMCIVGILYELKLRDKA